MGILEMAAQPFCLLPTRDAVALSSLSDHLTKVSYEQSTIPSNFLYCELIMNVIIPYFMKLILL